jgi:nicotinamide phosphoribosyltransferase
MASTEHSVMCSSALIDKDETPSIKRLLTEVYPTGNFSMVCDSFDYWNVVTKILPSLKEEILKRDGTLFVRGDSGDPVMIIVRTVELLWEIFGGTTNSKGYKVLDSHVRAIYGDSITQERAKDIYQRLERQGFSAENVALGAGGFSMLSYQDAGGQMHMFTRDTFNVAIKCSYVEHKGNPIMVYKDPKTDTGMKKSHKGCCIVLLDGPQYKCMDGLTFKDTEISVNQFDTVFKDGKLVNSTSLVEVRQQLWGENF